MNHVDMEELTELIRNDMKPALGVTEPGAIAFAVATAEKHAGGRLKSVNVKLNSVRHGDRGNERSHQQNFHSGCSGI